jgi:hypothetical protein
MRKSKLFPFPATIALYVALGSASMADAPTEAPKHLNVAEALVQSLQGAPLNAYGGGPRHIDWNPATCSACTVCCSLVTLLLQHVYGWTNDDFKTWMQSSNPKADAYHDAIVAENGFKRLKKVEDIEPGDFLAIKYTDGHVSRNGVVDTGHIMLVAEKPQEIHEHDPIVPDTEQYLVVVIDSSASGHGPRDTRHRADGSFTGGIGRGEFRIYANSEGGIVGYAWSDGSKSEYECSPSRDLVAGRLLDLGRHPYNLRGAATDRRPVDEGARPRVFQ